MTLYKSDFLKNVAEKHALTTSIPSENISGTVKVGICGTEVDVQNENIHFLKVSRESATLLAKFSMFQTGSKGK